MRYILLLYADENAEPETAACRSVRDELIQAGAWIDGARLCSVDSATTVRVRRAEVTICDGPSEDDASLAGYCVIECPDLDEALAWAARFPGARRGAVEVRPLEENQG